MAVLPQTYNTADLPDGGAGMPLIPPGQYQAVILNSEMVATRSGAGQMLVLDVTITQGQYANTEFKERLNIINSNPVAVEIAYKTLARVSEALGMVQTPADSTQLHNKPLMIEIATEAGEPYVDNAGVQKQGKDKSIISKWLALPAGGAPNPLAQGAAVSPSPAAVSPVPASAPPPAVAQSGAATQNAFVATEPPAQATEAAAPPPANPFAAS